MGFYFRKSLKAGPLRINLSKSGIGTSFGIKGLRIGRDAKGRNYTHIGRYGIYYKEYFLDKDMNSEENMYNHPSNLSPFQKELRESKINISCLLIAMGIFWFMPVLRYSFITIIYFYPTLTGIRFKTLNLKIFAMNFFTGWTIIGWLVAYAWAIPKFYTADSSNPEYAEIFHNAYNLLTAVKENEAELKLILKPIPDILYKYVNTPMEKIPDKHIEQMADIYQNYRCFKENKLKQLPPLRHSQAKLNGYTTFLEDTPKPVITEEENITISKNDENISPVTEFVNTLCGVGCLVLIMIIIFLIIVSFITN